MFRLKKSDRILDLGCGDGLNIQLLHSRGITNIIGVDISSYMLKEARIRNPHVTLELASSNNLPFKDNYFDIVFVDSVFHQLLHLFGSLAEIRRVLVRSGKLCFIEPHKSGFRKIFDIMTLSPIAFVIPALLRRRESYLAERDIMESWLKEKEEVFLSSLEQKGFHKDFCRYHLLSVIGQYRKL